MAGLQLSDNDASLCSEKQRTTSVLNEMKQEYGEHFLSLGSKQLLFQTRNTIEKLYDHIGIPLDDFINTSISQVPVLDADIVNKFHSNDTSPFVHKYQCEPG